MAPVSIETLEAMAVITMIILTSDVTSTGFFHLSNVRNYAVHKCKKKKKRPNFPDQPKFRLVMKPK